MTLSWDILHQNLSEMSKKTKLMLKTGSKDTEREQRRHDTKVLTTIYTLNQTSILDVALVINKN